MRIEVDPDVLVRSGQRLGSTGTQLGMLSDALSAALGSGIAAGWDPAGANFGFKYGSQAQDFADALADGANSFKSVGYMLEATGYNYENADAASTIGGSAPTGGVGGEPSKTTAGDAPPGSSSAIVPPPAKWTLIEPLLTMLPGLGLFAGAAMTWPTGNPSLLRVTAAQWKNLATGLSAFDDDITGLKAVISQQHIPEDGKIGEALGALGDQLSKMSEFASTFATSIDDFASGVQDTQDAIRRLLDRISLDGLWDTVTGFLTGDGDDILREVAHDVGEVLENFQNQVKGVVGLLEDLVTLIGDAATAFQKWIRPILVAQFGDDVGNSLADAVTLYTDFQVGLVTGLINTVSGVVSLADPDTWKGMAEMALSVAEDPSTLPGVLENMGKQFVAWDKWSGDHPGRAAGEAAFNIGSLFVPGGALTKTGNLAKGLRYGSKLLEEGRLPRFSDLPGLGGTRHELPGLDDVPGAGPRVPNVPEFRPAAVPDSVLGPSAPHGIDAPTSPVRLGVPGGAPDPPGPASTPVGPNGHGGGDGPPPDPPGRSVGPSDSGPGRIDGPTPQSPASFGPGSVDSPHNSDQSTPAPAPSSGDSPTHGTQQPPESSSPAGSHDTDRSQTEPGSPPADQAPKAEAPGNGSVTEHRGSGYDAPGESHRPASENYGGHVEEHSPTPVDHQPGFPPAAEHSDGHERTAPDGSPTREQPTGDGRGHDPADTTPSVMTGTGTPTASHVLGGLSNSAEGQHSSGRTQTPEAPTRGTEGKGTQPGSPENPRTQAPTGAGPGPGNASGAPVTPTPTTASVSAAGQHMSSAVPESTRTPEPPAPRSGDGTRDGSPTPHPEADRPVHQPDPPHSNQNASTGITHNQSPDPVGPPGNPADARVYGPHELRPVEDPAYQTAVEDALRDADGNVLVHADPRTNDYGNLVNDGGPTVLGRSNNCLDCSLSALSSFLGDPTVSAPRHLDRLPDKTIDRWSGEQGGLRRASDWLGGGMLEFHGRSLAEQFDALHHYVDDLGPGSAALVVNGWHARDLDTAELLYQPDGSPMTDGSHATVVVYPEGASGPVWWDPQRGLTSDQPPSWMTDQSSLLNFTPIDPNQGAHHGGAGNQGTGAGVSGEDVADRDVSSSPVPPRVGGHEDPEPGTDDVGRGGGVGPSGDRFGDGNRVGVPELVDSDGGGGVHGVQGDGREPSGPADLSVPVVDHSAADPGGRSDDRVSADRGVADRPSGANTTPPAQDREAHVPIGSDGLAVDRGDVLRGVGEQSEPGSVAGDGDDPGVGGANSDRSSIDHRGLDAPPNNPPHTGLHDPPANHGIAGDRLPDMSSINTEFRLANGVVDPDRFDEWTRAVSDTYPPIGDDGVAGVYDYTTENYQGMNPYLRDIDPLSPQQQLILGADSVDRMTDGQRSSWEQRISDADDGLAALPPYRADPADAMSTTWRGMHASDELLAQLEVGDRFEDAAYLSSSLDSRVAGDFALSADAGKTPTLLSIEGYDGVDVSQLSRYTDEAEILFPRGSRFEVVSRDVGDDGLIHILLRQIQP